MHKDVYFIYMAHLYTHIHVYIYIYLRYRTTVYMKHTDVMYDMYVYEYIIYMCVKHIGWLICIFWTMSIYFFLNVFFRPFTPQKRSQKHQSFPNWECANVNVHDVHARLNGFAYTNNHFHRCPFAKWSIGGVSISGELHERKNSTRFFHHAAQVIETSRSDLPLPQVFT